jgi:uncharacterized protein YbjQ (UPF0145 family)
MSSAPRVGRDPVDGGRPPERQLTVPRHHRGTGDTAEGWPLPVRTGSLPAHAKPSSGGAMLITTANDFPELTIERTLGEVFGLTVRSRNIGSQFGAGIKSLFGGELQGMTKMLAQGREQAIQRLVDEATRRGGNAIVAMRFDTSELGGTWTEICAYGTAVVVRAA